MTIEPLSGGLANYCYRVSSKDHEHSVVLKYGEETMKVVSSIIETSSFPYYFFMHCLCAHHHKCAKIDKMG